MCTFVIKQRQSFVTILLFVHNHYTITLVSRKYKPVRILFKSYKCTENILLTVSRKRFSMPEYAPYFYSYQVPLVIIELRNALLNSSDNFSWQYFARSNSEPFSKPLLSSRDNSSKKRFMTHLSFRDEPELAGDLLISKWRNFLSCFSLCLVNVSCSLEWQNSLTLEVSELLIKAESSLSEQRNNIHNHSVELWHSCIRNFWKEKPVWTMSLYPLSLRKEGVNCKLDGST